MASAPQGVTLRSMQPADRAGVLDLWVASWQAAYPAIDFASRREWMASRLDHLQASGAQALVAVHDGRIVGLATIDPATGYLDQLVVAVDRQRRGIAGLLLEEVRRLSPARIELHVNEDNSPAIRFYKRNGFVVTGSDVNARSGAPVHKMSWKP